MLSFLEIAFAGTLSLRLLGIVETPVASRAYILSICSYILTQTACAISSAQHCLWINAGWLAGCWRWRSNTELLICPHSPTTQHVPLLVSSVSHKRYNSSPISSGPRPRSYSWYFSFILHSVRQQVLDAWLQNEPWIRPFLPIPTVTFLVQSPLISCRIGAPAS